MTSQRLIIDDYLQSFDYCHTHTCAGQVSSVKPRFCKYLCNYEGRGNNVTRHEKSKVCLRDSGDDHDSDDSDDSEDDEKAGPPKNVVAKPVAEVTATATTATTATTTPPK